MPQEPARLPPCLSHRHPGSGGCPRCWGPMRGWGPSVWLSRSSASERGFHRATVHEAHACPARLPPRPGAADRSVPAFPPRPSSARRGPGAAVPGVSRAVAPGTSRVLSAFGLAVTRCVLKRGRRKLFGKNTVQRERGACASARAPVRPSSHSATCRSVGASPCPSASVPCCSLVSPGVWNAVPTWPRGGWLPVLQARFPGRVAHGNDPGCYPGQSRCSRWPRPLPEQGLQAPGTTALYS